MSSSLISRPFRVVLRWQLVATAGLAVLAALWAGVQGAISAALGGVINVIAGLVYALLIVAGTGNNRVRGAGVALMTMFRAEAGKILAIIVQMGIVLSMYRDVVYVAFFGAFIVTVVVFSLAFFVRD